MGISDVPSLPSILTVLRAMDSRAQGTTASQLCMFTGLSRGAIDHSLRFLISANLVSRGIRRFGRPVPLAITTKGERALQHVRNLEALLSID